MLLLPIYVLSNDQPTTGTISLGDLFSIRPGTDGYQAGPPRFDRKGPVLLIPDTSAWRLPPPTPSPSPTPTPIVVDGFEIPKLPPSIARKEEEVREEMNPGFLRRGLALPPPPDRRARVILHNRWKELRVHYRLMPTTREGKPSGRPLDIMHATDTLEELTLPSGFWRLELRYWRYDSMQSVGVLRYQALEMLPEEIYQFRTDPDIERNLTLELRKSE